MSITTDTHAHSDDALLTIRSLGRSDLGALSRLAQRDSAALPAMPALGAELDGRLVAALSLSDRDTRPLADPFVATAGAVELLRMRAAQVRVADDDSHRGRRRRRPRLQRRRARGALAGSPPGSSRLLQL